MKNITVSLRDDEYRAARIEAAKRSTSVSALVRGFLAHLPDGDMVSDKESAERNRLMETLLRRTRRFRMGEKPVREELHAR